MEKLAKKQKKILVLVLIGVFSIAIMLVVLSNPLTQAKLYQITHEQQLSANGNEIVIIPILTANAYKKGGFYDYYSGKCSTECLTVPIDLNATLMEHSSALLVRIFQSLGYDTQNDFVIDYRLKTDPNYLKQYDKVIVLHSEYVTQRIFDALQKHPKVVYLVPNALYGKIEINEDTMRLIQGHGYIINDSGFAWKYDNTHPYEYQKDNCTPDKLSKIENGWQLQCNPELTIWKNFDLLMTVKKL